jgi:hypothetical protein
LIYVVMIFVAFGIFAAGVILRMETLRRRALPPEGVTGLVVRKRVAGESGSVGGAPVGGVAVLPLPVVPQSFLLTIATAAGEREFVVDEWDFARYEVGDSYPGSESV